MNRVKNIFFKLLKNQSFIFSFCFISIIFISLFLRVYLPYSNVMQQPIRYAADDGVYHMRIVENLLLGGHYPKKIYFDPFTYFPYGTYIHFAPLYDQLLAFVIYVASLGKPTETIIHKISPFYPAVLGTLAVIIAYFIGKYLFGKREGLLSALLFSLSTPFLFRSLLGATDHHQAEVLFSSLAILFFILLILNHQDKKRFWIYTILLGVSLGLYFLTWNGALLFLLIFFLFVIFYYLIEFYFNHYPDWLLMSSTFAFVIPLLMITPFLGHPDIYHSPLYNILHIGSFLVAIIVFIGLFLVSRYFQRKKIDKKYFLLFLIVLSLIFILGFQIFFPNVFESLIEGLKVINIGIISQMGPVEWRGAARETIGEMSPMSFQSAFGSYGCLLYLSFLGLIILIIRYKKERKPLDLFLVLWTLFFFLITGIFTTRIGQSRFSYYLSLNIALLSSFVIIKVIDLIKEINRKSFENEKESLFLRIGSFSLIFNFIILVFYPFPFNLTDQFPYNLPKIIIEPYFSARYGGVGREEDWYETLKWLKEKTPDPGLDFYSLYQEPKYNFKLGKIEPYPYPDSAYGVLSTWDVGHIITYYAHRMPTANQFQQGIGRVDEELGIAVPGEASFFIENEEEKAIKMLDELKTKYIITDYGSAVGYGAFMGKTKWALGDTKGYYLKEESGQLVTTRKYDKSMIVRLHYFDGREWKYKDVEESYVKYLDHFRLVYESKTSVFPSFFEYEKNDENNNIRLVKIFEYVKGAKIIGFAPSGTKVKISTKITTNQGRKFTYEKSTISQDGKFEFIVPYSTEGKNGWLENGTKFEVFAEPYEIKIGEKIIKINVKEKDIISGNSIYLNK